MKEVNSFFLDDETDDIVMEDMRIEKSDSELFEYDKNQRMKTIKNNFILVLILNIICIL